MFADIINREIVEFNCIDEDTARRILTQIEVNTIRQFNDIISSVLSNSRYSLNNLKIDTLEIDLGDIHPYYFENGEVLSIFREQFEKKIADIQRSLNNGVKIGNDGIRIGTERDSVIVSSVTENELELIKTFILSGDVPWW